MKFLIIVSHKSDGTDVATGCYGGRVFTKATRRGAEMAVARALRDAGAPDGPWESQGAGRRPRLTGPSLHRLAKFIIHEGNGRPRLVRHIPANGKLLERFSKASGIQGSPHHLKAPEDASVHLLGPCGAHPADQSRQGAEAALTAGGM